MKNLILITAIAILSLVTFTGMSLAGSPGADLTAESGADASVTQIDNSVVKNKGGRGYIVPPDIKYGPVINYFTKPLPSEGFQPVESLLMYSTWFTKDALVAIVDGDGDAEAEFMPINKELKAPGLYRTRDEEKIQWIKIVVSKEPVKGAYGIGFVTARSDDRRTGMPKVMAKGALEAMANGCNVVQYIAQGAVRDAFSTGWGIGFNTSYGKLHGNDDDEATVGGGGFGYSSAEAGMRDKPWLQGHGLWVTGLKAPEFSKPVPEVQALIDADNAKMAAKADAKKKLTNKPATKKITGSARKTPAQTGNHRNDNS
jgi:hypothetical protein